MSKLLGIGGVSRSGKSTLAEKIKYQFASQKVLIISQDEYVKPAGGIPKIKEITDWEHPDSIDFSKILNTIIEKRNYYDLLIVEGLLAYHNERLNGLFDYRIMMNISKETFLARRKKEKRWGTEPTWYWEHVWESYLKFGQTSTKDLFTISGETPMEPQTFEKIVKYLMS